MSGIGRIDESATFHHHNLGIDPQIFQLGLNILGHHAGLRQIRADHIAVGDGGVKAIRETGFGQKSFSLLGIVVWPGRAITTARNSARSKVAGYH